MLAVTQTLKDPLHWRAFVSARQGLQRRLQDAERVDETGFLKIYRDLRLNAFKLEFLAKFFRKASRTQRDIYEDLIALTKPLEDRLGKLDELDAMVPFCERSELRLDADHTGADHFRELRAFEYEQLRHWMREHGWTHHTQGDSALNHLDVLLLQLEPLNDDELRAYAAEHWAESAKRLQRHFDDRDWEPSSKKGYRLREVEPKVHEARRSIRKHAMFMSYLPGLFALDADASANYYSKPMRKLASRFCELETSELATSDFAKLPGGPFAKKLHLPRPLFLAITRYVSDLGVAKDWALNLSAARAAGLHGEISFDHLDPQLQIFTHVPVPFNRLVAEIFAEIRETRLFSHLADAIEKQGKG